MDRDTIDKAVEGEKRIELFIREGGKQNSLKSALKKLLSGKSELSDKMIFAWQGKADIVFRTYGVPEEKRNSKLYFDMNVRYNLVKNLLSELRK